MKKTALALWAAVMLLVFGGCGLVRVEKAPREPLDYTLVNSREVPEEIKKLIETKKTREFQMTYQSGEDLYLIKGYGQQLTGGYSIQVEELGISENAVFFRTKLLGPQEDEAGKEPSCPCIVVKIKFREEPVVFE